MTPCSLGGNRHFGGTAASIFRVEVSRFRDGLAYVSKVVMNPNEGDKERNTVLDKSGHKMAPIRGTLSYRRTWESE